MAQVPGHSGCLGDNPPAMPDIRSSLRTSTAPYSLSREPIPTTTGRLWKSDGTAAGTVFVDQVNRPQELTAVGDTLYYREPNSGNGESLWQSDGTAAGTIVLQNYGDGSSNYYDLYPANLTNVGGKLYFSAGDLQHGNELRVHSPEFIIPSETEISASQTSAVVGEEVTLTATVDAMPPYGGNPTGTVSFWSGATHLGTATLSLVDGEKRASIVASSPVAGTFPIRAEYSGDVNFARAPRPPCRQPYTPPTATTLSPQSMMTTTDDASPYQAKVKSSRPRSNFTRTNVAPSESTTGLPSRNRLLGVAAERLFGVADTWWS